MEKITDHWPTVVRLDHDMVSKGTFMPEKKLTMQGPKEKITQELVQFDLNIKYGPALHITRLKRWERAARFGLQPPQSIGDILTEISKQEDGGGDELMMSFFEGKVV